MRRSFRRHLVIAMIGGLTALAVAGCGESSRPIDVSGASIPLPANPAEASVYLTIVNSGDTDDRLLSVESPSAVAVHLHETTIADNGFASMTAVPTLTIPAGMTIALKPGGLHLMMMTSKPLAEGDRVKLTLTFEHAGALHTEARVSSALGTP
ncbi:MAG: copper chaperone PCu(A)C [Acidimicrobiales bacterium]